MSQDQSQLPRGRHCMVVHHAYPLDPRVERDALALVRHGYPVDVICLRNEGEAAFQTVDGVNVYRLPMRRDKRRGLGGQMLEYLSFFFLALFQLVKLHSRRHYAVVQVHNLPDFLVFAALFPKLTGAKVILDIHDVMPEFYAARFHRDMNSLPVRLVRWEETLSCLFADHVITVSDLWRDALIARGVPAKKISVVMNLPDEHIFQPAAAGLTGSHNGTFKLFYHGNVTRRYGLDLAVRAVDQVRQKVPGVQMIIRGRGDDLQGVMRLTRELDLEGCVHFVTEAVPLPELVKLIAQADLAIIPYRRDVFTDGVLPTKLMEYAALGIPAVAARTPIITTYFDESMVQFFTPEDVNELAQCILALQADRQRLGELARNATKFNQRYNWTKMAAEYVSLVERLGNSAITS